VLLFTFCLVFAGSEELVPINNGIQKLLSQNEQLLAFLTHDDKSEDMSAMTSEPLKLKKTEYREVSPVICTKTGAVPAYDWSDGDAWEVNEKKCHPGLQEVLNKTLEPAGFYALLPTNTAKEDTTYPLSSGVVRKVRGQPDAYIFKLPKNKDQFNRNAVVDSANMGRAVAVVEWKKPSTMEVDKSYAQMCFEVFAFGERLRGKAVIGLLTDHSTSAALFSFDARRGTYQCFESADTGMGRSYLMPLERAILELVEWLKADKKPIQHALPVIPEDEHDGDSSEGDADEDSSDRGPGAGGAGRKKSEPSSGGSGSGDSSSSHAASAASFKRKALGPHAFVAGSCHVTPPKTAGEAITDRADEGNDACSTVDDGENEDEESWPLEAGDGHFSFETWRDRVPTHLRQFLP
jgi:hypothetical protein